MTHFAQLLRDLLTYLLTSQVKWAFSDELERRVALKVINKKRAPIDFQQKFLPRELETMKLLNHPNIVKLYDVICIKDKVRAGSFSFSSRSTTVMSL